MTSIALVGRPNVGKSTLFNYLTKTRDALVADAPGLTRDRKYGRIQRGHTKAWLIDTGGIVDKPSMMEQQALGQVQHALDEADLILFLVDARAGMNSLDAVIAEQLRKGGKPVILVANKRDGLNPETAGLEFFDLGFGQPVLISSSHGHGVPRLLDTIDKLIPVQSETDSQQQETELEGRLRIAIIGRPNVGKSTLVNRLLGEDRVVVFDEPGTTRDSIYIPFERDGKPCVLIDTAGVRRRSKVGRGVEKFSVIKSLQAMEDANVIIFLIDAREGVTDQDATLLGLVENMGRSLVIGFNKWDGMSEDQKQEMQRKIDLKLTFLDYATQLRVSALHGTGVGDLFDAACKAYDSSIKQFPSAQVTRTLEKIVEQHQPPLIRGRRIKLKFAHQNGTNPPTIVIHGNQTKLVPAAYKRYLINQFRKQFRLSGTPLKLIFKTGHNPFAARVKSKPEAVARNGKNNSQKHK
ncbi:MAG TPA: ribosome biogenesis GTPase Der [Crenotrichaceae bacterium]|nr:ribosome biogenesis GTPase Der [Crenotrichaceae bacterium]